MEPKRLTLLIVLGVVIVAAAFVMNSYNGLVMGQERVKKTWGDVQTQYQRRVDLIGNVVETAKGSANFEQETLRMVVEARSAWAKASSAGNLNDQIRESNEAAPLVNSALSRLLVTVEAYPQLGSVATFRDVITELEGTENRISVARRDFNGAIQNYNVKVRQFPSSLIAGMFGFEMMENFKADEGAEKAPKVEFDFNKK